MLIPLKNRDGDVYINKKNIQDGIYITEGIYRANNYVAKVEVVNQSQTEAVININNHLEVKTYSSEDFIELYSMTCEDTGTKLSTESELNIRTDHLNKEEKEEILILCKKYIQLFYKESDQLTATNGTRHVIRLSDEEPIHIRPFRYSFKENEVIKRQITELLDQNIIRNSYSPWSSPVWLVPKKSDASGQKK